MKRTLKKSLSFVLSLIMILTSLTVGFSAIASTPLIVKDTTTTHSQVRMAVPEQIYLMPDLMSWKNTTYSRFQYYANTKFKTNSTTGNLELVPVADERNQTTGKIYIDAPSTVDLTTATLSVKAIDANGAALTLGGGQTTIAKVGQTNLTSSNYATDVSGGAFTESTSTSGVHTVTGGLSITAGNSPSLSASTDGYYLLWDLSYNDTSVLVKDPDTGAYVTELSLDQKNRTTNNTYHTYALTYVYKPYTIPVAAGVESYKNGGVKSTRSVNDAVVWMTGFYSIENNTERTDASPDSKHEAGPTYYATTSGARPGSAGFINNGTTYRNNNTDKTVATLTKNLNQNNTELWPAASWTHTGGTMENVLAGVFDRNHNTEDGKADFAVISDANPGWYVNNGGNAQDPGGEKRYVLPTGVTSNMSYQRHETGGTKDWGTVNEMSHAKGTITIDTSRYTNLKYIPNLSVGLMCTGDENSDDNSGSWYISDVTSLGITANDLRCDKGETNEFANTVFNSQGTIFAGQTSGKSSSPCREYVGVRYAGTWPSAISSTVNNTNYVVKGLLTNYHGSNHAIASCVVPLHATQVNKQSLRNTVDAAQANMGKIGLDGYTGNNKFSSKYFANGTTSASSLDSWCQKYFAAAKALVTLGTSSVSTEQSDLSTATLKAAVHFDTNDARYNNAVSFNGVTANGTYDVNLTTEKTSSPVVFPSNSNTVTQINIPSGYRFAGFSTNPNASYSTTNNPELLTGVNNFCGYNETYYVILEPDHITFTFDTQNGTPQTPNTTVDYNDTPGKVLVDAVLPAKEGYTFNGYRDLNGTNNKAVIDAQGNYTADNGVVKYSGNGSIVNLTADWTANQYDVTLQKEDGTAQTALPIKVTYDSNTVPTQAVPTKTGFDFLGWFEEGATTPFIGADGAPTAPNDTLWKTARNVTAKQRFTEHTYSLTLIDGDQASGGQGTASVKFNGFFANLTSRPSKPGYVFTGYNTASDGNGLQIFNGDGTCVMTSPWTYTNYDKLYATWTPASYTFKYSNDNGLTFDQISNILYGADIRSYEILPTRDGYDFRGYKDNAGNTYIGSDGKFTSSTWLWTPVTNIVEANADWHAKDFDIFFQSNGGTQMMSIRVTYDSTVPAIPLPTRVGYKFNGYTDQDGEKVVAAPAAGATTGTYVKNGKGTYTVNGNSSLTPDWEVEKYTVVFMTKQNDANAYSEFARCTDVEYNTQMPAAFQIKTAPAHYDQAAHYAQTSAWYYLDANNNQVDFSLTAPIQSDMTLYAKYDAGTPHNYSVPVDHQDATCQTNGYDINRCDGCDRIQTTTIGLSSAYHHFGWIEDTPATCQHPGSKHEECSFCHTHRNDNTVIPQGRHEIDTSKTYSITVENDIQYHQGECRYCHQPIAKQACYGGTADCMHKAICEVCANEYGTEDKTNHVQGCHVVEYQQYVAATCHSDGCTTGTWYSMCHKIVNESQDISMTTVPHVLSSGNDVKWINGQAPDCNNEGRGYHYCLNEGCTYQDTDPAHVVVVPGGHVWDGQTRFKTAATCHHCEIDEKHCSRCDQWFEFNVGRPLDHLFEGEYHDCDPSVDADGTGNQLSAPTCTESGWRYQVCSRCQQAEGSAFDADGNFTTANGYCGAKKYIAVAKLGHDWITVPGKEPNCSHTGYKEGRYCQRCGAWENDFDPQDPANILPIDPDNHTDYDHDGWCDDCDKEVVEEYDNEGKCGCICHMAEHSVFCKIIYSICRLFWRLFNYNQTCVCGRTHWEVKK